MHFAATMLQQCCNNVFTGSHCVGAWLQEAGTSSAYRRFLTNHRSEAYFRSVSTVEGILPNLGAASFQFGQTAVVGDTVLQLGKIAVT